MTDIRRLDLIGICYLDAYILNLLLMQEIGIFKMECFVTQPNSIVLQIIVNPKGKGHECMDQVCRLLGIVEQDYFGLQYKGSRNENLWLNLRNRLDRQLVGQSPYRLLLKVKFFVPPHILIQATTRSIFYDQVKADLDSQTLVIDNDEQVKNISVLIAQAEYGNFNRSTHQLNQYKNLVNGMAEPTSQLVHDIVDSHEKLMGISRETAQYKLLQIASGLENYGVENHYAVYDGQRVHVGIGPKGVVLQNSSLELLEKLEYQAIVKAEYMAKICHLRVMNDNGTEREIVLKHNTQCSANAMYRCITEMYSFFICDTINNDVSTQFSLDLKGTLASIFNEKTTLGRDYVFDIKRTSREAYDHARRQLHHPAFEAGDVSTARLKGMKKNDYTCEENITALEEKCQALEDTLDSVEDSFTCCVCRDEELSAVLCPCGHLTCIQCAEKLTCCPICRMEIKNVQKIFLPEIHCQGATCASSVSSLLQTMTTPEHNNSHKRRRKEDLCHSDCSES